MIIALTFNLLRDFGDLNPFFINYRVKCALGVHIFKHIMDLFLNELDFMVIGHIYPDRGYPISFKSISHDK